MHPGSAGCCQSQQQLRQQWWVRRSRACLCFGLQLPLLSCPCVGTADMITQVISRS